MRGYCGRHKQVGQLWQYLLLCRVQCNIYAIYCTVEYSAIFAAKYIASWWMLVTCWVCIHCILYSVYCITHSLYSLVIIVHCTTYTAQRTDYTVQCNLHCVQNFVCTSDCSQCYLNCTVYTDH